MKLLREAGHGLGIDEERQLDDARVWSTGDLDEALRALLGGDDLDHALSVMAADPLGYAHRLASDQAAGRLLVKMVQDRTKLRDDVGLSDASDRSLFAVASELLRVDPRLGKKLFEKRFRVDVRRLPPSAIEELWGELMRLPEEHVRNREIRHFSTLSNSSDFLGTWSEETGTVSLRYKESFGEDPSSFEATCRHEVGHAVHDMRRDEVDEFLADYVEEFSFTTQDAKMLIEKLNYGDNPPYIGPLKLIRLMRDANKAWEKGNELEAEGYSSQLIAFLKESGFYFSHQDYAVDKDGDTWAFSDHYSKFYRYKTSSEYNAREIWALSEYSAFSNSDMFAEIYDLYYDPARQTPLPKNASDFIASLEVPPPPKSTKKKPSKANR